jgi:Protein of unknown function (DUF3300)
MTLRVSAWTLRPLAFLLFLCSVPATLLNAQAPPLPTPQELDQLLAPVALYPDSLLAQITTAATNPQEILDVDNWLHQNSGLSGPDLANAAQAQGFDPAFIALTSFPQVLDMMAQNIDDYAAIGEAFEANQGEVMDSVQRLRHQAYAAGALASNPQQQVVVQGATIVIQPANPQFVYLPQYDPAVVYGYSGPSVGAGTFITFGAGIALGLALGPSHPWGWGGWGWNWGHRTVLYNRAPWAVRYNVYRPRTTTYRPRPPSYQNRPGYGGKWNQKPAQPSRPAPGRPQTQPVRPPPNQPQVKPAPTRPNNTQRPAPAPNRQPRPAPNQPQTKPAPTPPHNTLRPAPAPNRQPRPAPAQPQAGPAPTPPHNTMRPAHSPNGQPRPAPAQPQAGPAPTRPNNTQRPAPAPNRQPRPATAQPQARPAPKQQQQPPENEPAPRQQRQQ